jgi:large subunit ribosomal protein L4
MLEAPLYDMSGRLLRQVELPADVFGVEANRAVMHQALVRQLANARQGTHNTQNRSDVSRTSAKWFRQKGTGRARHGAREAALFVGGGIAHGPHPRSYRVAMPRRMRRLALRSALSARAAESAIVLVDDLAMDAPRTRAFRDLVDQVCDGASTLVVLAGANDAVERSVRNLGYVRYLRAAYLNVRDLLGYDRLLIPLDAFDAVVAHLSEAHLEEVDHA